MTREGRLNGRAVVISGAAGSLGRVQALHLGQEGASLTLGDVNLPRLRHIVHELEGLHVRAIAVELDVREPSEWERAVDTARQTFGGPDVLVNNAGIFHPAGLEDTDLETWKHLTAVNERGVWLGMKYAVAAMRPNHSGSIVNIASVDGIVGHSSGLAYQASKGAVLALTRAAAIELAREGIRVNAVCPGVMETRMDVVGGKRHRVIAEQKAIREQVIEEIPLGRAGTPTDVAHAVTYLASDESAFVTGSALIVDGGYTAK